MSKPSGPHAFDPDAPAPPGAGIFGLDAAPEDAGVLILPVPFEATTSYRQGTAKGPEAILKASHQIDLFDLEVGQPWQSGIALLDASPTMLEWNREATAFARPIHLEGGLQQDSSEHLQQAALRVNQIGARLNLQVEEAALHWLRKDRLFVVLGGDHSVPFGAIQAQARVEGEFGILHIDAHADLRDSYEGFRWSHASIMHNVLQEIPQVTRLVQVGIRDLGRAEYQAIQESKGRIVTFFDPVLQAAAFQGHSWATQCQEIVEALPEKVYLSLDIDGLDPAFCPSTGTPVPGGLSFYQMSFLLRTLVESGRRILGFDLVEVAPGPDGNEWDAIVGARLLYKLIGWSLLSRQNS